MVYTRIRNLELVLRSHIDIVDRVPEDILILPKFEDCEQQFEGTYPHDDDNNSRLGSEPGSEHAYGHDEMDPCDAGHDEHGNTGKHFAPLTCARCGELPLGVSLETIACAAQTTLGRSLEAR